jgi:hypothetical protein
LDSSIIDPGGGGTTAATNQNYYNNSYFQNFNNTGGAGYQRKNTDVSKEDNHSQKLNTEVTNIIIDLNLIESSIIFKFKLHFSRESANAKSTTSFNCGLAKR